MDDLNKIMQDWTDDLDGEQKSRNLRDVFISCDTQGEVTNMVRVNQKFFEDYPDAIIMVRDARIRIARIYKEKLKSWKNLSN